MAQRSEFLTHAIVIMLGLTCAFFTLSSPLNGIVEFLVFLYSFWSFSHLMTSFLAFDSFRKNGKILLIALITRPVAFFFFGAINLTSLFFIYIVLVGFSFIYYSYGLRNLQHTLYGLIRPIQFALIIYGITEIWGGINGFFYMKPLGMSAKFLNLQLTTIIYSFAIAKGTIAVCILAMFSFVFYRYSKQEQTKEIQS